jgi:hypothetical protein
MKAGRGTALIAVVAALMLGVGAGVVLDRTRSKPQPVVLPVSQWSSPANGTKIVAGSLASDPNRGVVLYENKRLGPSLFSTPARSGPLHLVSSTYGSWVLETSQGARAVLQFADDQGRPAFEMLGPRLDPGHLPALTRQGLAVPVVYGQKRVKAVLLVGVRNPYTFPVYGYLAGFSLPVAQPTTAALARPLLGPDHRLYRVDRAARRLVPVGRSLERAAAPFKIPPRCSTWPTTAGRVLACAASIQLIRPDGTRTALLRQPGISQSNTRWVFVSPSPNGRTLLLEQDIYACGADRQAYFLSTRGGALRRAVGDVATQSEPLGWLGGGAALVAIQYGECDGTGRSGLYRAYPDGSDGLIVATSGQDATLWGSRSGPLTSAF